MRKQLAFLVCMLMISGVVLADEAKREVGGNQGYIYGSPDVKKSLDAEEAHHHREAPDVIGGIKNLETWIEKNLW